MLNNPYIAGNPVGKTEAFIGRLDILREVLKVIKNHNQNALALYGQRRIGKTSILQYLSTQLSTTGNYRPVYFDLQDKAALSLSRVIEDLARTIAIEFKNKEPNLGEKPEITFKDSWLPTLLESLSEDEKLILLFDEFDVLADPTGEQAAKAFFPYLRTLLELDLNRLEFVFVLGRSIDDLDSIALSVFKGIPAYRVTLLDKNDTEELVYLSERNGTLRWTKDAVNHLWELTHGHPYLTQQLCSQVWDILYDSEPKNIPEVKAADVEAAIQKTMDASRNALEWIWNGLPPAERVVISALAEAGPYVITQEKLEQILHNSGVRVLIRELRDAPTLLQEWDLIEPSNGKKDNYTFRVELLRRWLMLAKPLRRVQEELDRLTPVADNLSKAAQGLYELGRLEEATGLLQQAVAQNPNHLRANELLGEIYITQNQWDEARKLYERLYEFHPTVARSRLVQALLALVGETDDDSAKIRFYTRVLELEPHKHSNLKAEVDKLRSVVLAQELDKLNRLQAENRYVDAKSRAEDLAEIYPDEYDWQSLIFSIDRRLDLKNIYQRAIDALQRNDMRDASRLFSDVVAVDPEFEDAARYLGLAVNGLDAVKLKKQVYRQTLLLVFLGIMLVVLVAGLIWTSSQYTKVIGQATQFANVALPALWTSTPEPTSTSTHSVTPVISITPTLKPMIGDTIKVFGKGDLNSIAVSPNGKLLGIGTDIGVYIYDFESLQEHAFLSVPSSVNAINFSSNSEMIATGSSDGVVRIWRVSDLHQISVLVGHKSGITGLDFSPDSQQLVTGSFDYTVRLWNVNEGSLLYTLKDHTSTVSSVAYSPDGLTVASGSYDNNVLVWNVADGQLLRTLNGHTSNVYRISYSPDGSLLASGSADRTAKIWSTSDGRLLRTLTGHTSTVYGLAFLLTGGKLATGSYDKTVRIWNLEDGSLEQTITGHTDPIRELVYSPDGGKIITQVDGGTVNVWNTDSYSLAKEINTFFGSQYVVVFSPDGKVVATGSSDDKIRLWDVSTGSVLDTLEGHTNTVSSIAFSPDGENLVSGSWDNTAWIWNVKDKNLVYTLTGHTDYVRGVAFSPDGFKVATASDDNTVKIWNAKDGSLIYTLEGHTDYVYCVAFSPDGLELASGSDDSTVRIWNVEDGSLIRTLEGHSNTVQSLMYSSDGNQLVTGSSDYTIRLWRIEDGSSASILRGQYGSILSVAFSPDGLSVASGSSDDTVWVRNVADGQVLFRSEGNTGSISSVAFSPDGSILATASYDGTIRFLRLK